MTLRQDTVFSLILAALKIVIPAKAGIQKKLKTGFRVRHGMTEKTIGKINPLEHCILSRKIAQ